MASRNENYTILLGAAVLVMADVNKKKRKQRRWWCTNLFKKHSGTGILMDLKSQEISGQYKNFTRMTPTDFENLLQRIGPHISKQETYFRTPISAQDRKKWTFAIFLKEKLQPPKKPLIRLKKWDFNQYIKIDAGDQTLGNHLFTAAGNSKYTSHRIQNEIISLAGEVLLRSVVEEANSSKYFSVLADETADIAGHEQLSIGIRYVFEQNDKFTLKEEFLGFVKLDRLNADSIASSILQFLEKSGLSLDKLRLKNELQLIYSDDQYQNMEPRLLKESLFENRSIFKEAYKLLCLILTIPSTSVSTERSFSCLKRIKSYLRSTMSEDRLTNLAKISIEKELLNELIVSQPFYDDVINKFANLKDRRIALIYKQ
ncbi:unnamed protein product [Acanthoscelides obtectus]|nr:unnamed protein product [Acanthoscelides obtectus]CAK1632404.1 Zinc finger MYM-type protein 1 [Acanthoscelides obtectus]